MKKGLIICLLLGTLLNLKPYTVYGYKSDKNIQPRKIYLSGAASVSEIANGLLQALQTNNFDQLTAFLPTDAELAQLKKRGSEDMKAVLENRTAEDLKTTLKTEYETLVQAAIDKTLNWQEATVTEVKQGKPAVKNKMLQPAGIIINTKQNQLVRIVFETVKINNRYYLFRQIRLAASN